MQRFEKCLESRLIEQSHKILICLLLLLLLPVLWVNIMHASSRPHKQGGGEGGGGGRNSGWGKSGGPFESFFGLLHQGQTDRGEKRRKESTRHSPPHTMQKRNVRRHARPKKNREPPKVERCTQLTCAQETPLSHFQVLSLTALFGTKEAAVTLGLHPVCSFFSPNSSTEKKILQKRIRVLASRGFVSRSLASLASDRSCVTSRRG